MAGGTTARNVSQRATAFVDELMGRMDAYTVTRSDGSTPGRYGFSLRRWYVRHVSRSKEARAG